MNERFSSALDVLKETLQVPVARISLAESAQRSLWFNASSIGKTCDSESLCQHPHAVDRAKQYACRA